jgi:hypothetical protein
MTALSQVPQTFNFLNPTGFKFNILRAPNVNYFVQKTMLPGIASQSPMVPTPLVEIPKPGDHLLYDEYEFTFKVDENLNNWLEIYNWMKGAHKLEYHDYKQLEQEPPYSQLGVKSDISLTILTGQKKPNIQVIFHDAFPVRLSSIRLMTDVSDIDFCTADATFQYIYYSIKTLID